MRPFVCLKVLTRAKDSKDTATMTQTDSPNHVMYIRTPLIESRPLSELLRQTTDDGQQQQQPQHTGPTVFMKLENNQPSGSFKLRGISNMIRKEMERGCSRLVASSGGNAGLAAAYVSRKLKIPLTLYTPKSTGAQMLARLRDQGARVVVHGDAWDEADSRAREEAKDPTVGYIPPFDHPALWEGHKSMIVEIAEELEEKPDLVVLSVGGGGLMIGISQGMEEVGWSDVPILAMETEGANCFNAAVEAGQVVTLPAITSVATCLGALTVANRAYRLYHERPIISELITDRECIETIEKFLNDHHILVEPACAAAISAIYCGTVRRLQSEGSLPKQLRSVVLVVCGGVSVSLQMLQNWKQKFDIN